VTAARRPSYGRPVTDGPDIEGWSAEVARAEGRRLCREIRRGLLAGRSHAALLALAARRLDRLTAVQQVAAVAAIGGAADGGRSAAG
jgi:hypothetical protein